MGFYDDWCENYMNEALFKELCDLFTNKIVLPVEGLYGHLSSIVSENIFTIDLESYFRELVDWHFEGGKSNENY